jgi:xanthine dehydrogenase accessory factor
MKRAVFERLQAARSAKRPVALATELASGRQAILADGGASGDLALKDRQIAALRAALAADRSGMLAEEDGLFVQVFNPPLRLVIVGAVHIAQSLAPMARLAGYDVTLVDPRRAWANEARFPDLALNQAWPDEALRELDLDRRSAVAVLTHDPKLDDPALTVALASPAFYVGALGSRRTHAARLERLREGGMTEEALARIHAPIGLALGARSPAEISVSILAQMTQVLQGAAAPGSTPGSTP